MKTVKATMLSALAVAALLSGCSSVTNQGGDTKCKDFTGADEKTQNEAITKMLKDEGKNEPANLELTGTRLSIQTYCQTAGTQDSTIKEAPHL
jgi:acid stress chaperone HdeA